MQSFRLALLVIVSTSLAGLGVRASFGSATTPNSPAKKKVVAKNTAGHSAGRSAGKPAAASSSQKSTTGARPKSGNGKAGSAKVNSSKSIKSGKKGSGKGSSRSRKQTGQKAPTSERISEIQTALAREGAFTSSPNGIWDDQTSAAMRKFQSAHGLTANGKLDAPTLHRLGLGSQTAGIAAPTPPPGAVSRLSSSNAFSSANDSPQQ